MARPQILALAFVAIGCGKEPEAVPYVDVTIPRRNVSSGGANAFGAYANLAERAEDRAKLGLDARDTPGNRRKALAEMDPLLIELSAATRLPCTFLFKPVGPFAERPHQTGWLHLGRALVFRIDKAVEDGDWDGAAQWTVVATAFGTDLGGGCVSDATLGYGVLDGARRAVAPYIATMPPAALRILSDGLRGALKRLPDPAITIDNESALMLTAVKEIQRAHKAGKTDEFASKLYGTSRQAVLAFGKLEGPERNEFVQSLVEEAESFALQLRDRAMTAGAKRGPLREVLSGHAKSVADQFFTSGMPWLSVRDQVVARTRLLFLTAHINRLLDERGSVPPDLGGTPADLLTDPYTGLAMGYLPLGQDFVVYSYGLDGKDDRGDTDADRMRPDLLLEDAPL